VPQHAQNFGTQYNLYTQQTDENIKTRECSEAKVSKVNHALHKKKSGHYKGASKAQSKENNNIFSTHQAQQQKENDGLTYGAL
jgi:hypothetical protein